MNFINYFKKNKRSDEINQADLPLRAELFSGDQMERYGKALALSYTVTQKQAPDLLLARLADNENALIKACRTLTSMPTENNQISPAGEWLLDNFYLIKEQIRITKHHLPKGYGRSLLRLASGSSQGYPRVYGIALQIIAHGDGRWDAESLNRFMTAYQSVTPLTLGELWAIPIMLRLTLIENLRRVGVRIAANQVDRNLADGWANQMIEIAESDPKSLILVIANMANSNPPMNSPFVAELARRLERRGAALSLPLTWMEQRLEEIGYTVEQLVQMENQQQAANQVSVSNSIASLRRLGEMDWREFVQALSVVDHTLQKDPTGTYDKMDFSTRDRYRHVVERLARDSQQSEAEVAAMAIQLAESAKTDENIQAVRHRHVGYYLIGSGLEKLERAVGARLSWLKKIRRLIGNKCPLLCYLGSSLLITAVLTGGLMFKAGLVGMSPAWLIVFGIAAALSTSQLAMAFVNWCTMRLVTPHPLPKMDFKKTGIPEEFRTLVVVPAMLSSISSIESLIEGLEVRFLGNKDESLHFALLSDFIDSPTEHQSEDNQLLTLARERIEALNKRYCVNKPDDIFFLFHRPRRWNEGEQVWMGHERKRGKLADLNGLLRGNNQTPFSLIIGRIEIVSQIKYIITLDTDTQLPRASARQLVGAMAHPLNQPYYDNHKKRVTEGYGILQPRISEALPIGSGLTRYARLHSCELGIDPYTRMVSDVYQDLFDEGSFIGKGIYDVDIFKQALEQRFPENRILSHDLLEGCYLRSGLLSDVPLFEQSPGCYLADVKRRIRWIRGDWQLAGWLLPHVMQGNAKRVVNPLSLLSHWKLFDNLRRSLVSLSLLVLLGLSWTVLSASYFWFGAVLAIIVLPVFMGILWDVVSVLFTLLPWQNFIAALHQARCQLNQLLTTVAFLPHEAAYSLGAIVRTCWREMISHRHLLEWTPSDQASQSIPRTPFQWMCHMWVGPVLALAAGIVLSIKNQPALLIFTAPLLALWFISPLIAWWLSRPFRRPETKLDQAQLRFLHITARKTWGFFETFLTEADHWLPPDNYQEAPVEAIAHRTSPTNIGLALLANLTAYDFGYITTSQLLQRIANTVQTMTDLERYNGHFYNWYDTQTLEPLHPRFVSTVDSGNLAGHLLTLRQGLLALSHHTANDHRRYLSGLEDALDVLAETATKTSASVIDVFRQRLLKSPVNFDELYSIAEQIVVTELGQEWSYKLLSQCQAIRDELKLSRESYASMHLIIETLAAQIFSLAQMDNSFLYDTASHLMTVGFNVDEQKRDRGNYDLLSSEARLGNFVAIAQGQVPQESWFALGRMLTLTDGDPILMSWSGSMFEYLMPLIVMPSYSDTLLDQTCHAAVSRQIKYGKQRGVPWGISESGFNAIDVHQNYQYRAFGVPGLGLMRGLAEDLVIAPYATVMALMVSPEAACLNLQRLASEGAAGRFGFYEAVDYTPSRLPRGKTSVLVRSFMAHHQGMSFLSLSYLLHDRPMQRRFEADPLFQTALLLLQERIPKPVASYLPPTQFFDSAMVSDKAEASIRVYNSPNTANPEVQLLSNGSYHLMLTQAGSGYSRWKDIAVTRWREDSTCDNWGLFSYLRDLDTGEFWSTSYQPTVGHVENFKAIFSEAHAEFTRSDNKFDIHTEIVVSPEDDIELRRMRIYNRAKTHRTFDFTSYGEVVLAPQSDDQAQPAFSNLFIETEILPQQHAILATRRSRGDEKPPWLCHLLNVHSEESGTVSFETDRDRFIGRGHTVASPRAMMDQGPLSNTSGAVLDPIVAIRYRMTLEPGAMVTFDMVTGVTENREGCIALVEKYRDRRMSNRVFELAWTHAQVLLRQLNATEADAMLYAKLASAIIYANHVHRAESDILATNRRGQSGLWGYAISGDLPILLLYIRELANIDLARQLIQAHVYWRQKGLAVDLVILNEEHGGYRQVLQDQLMGLITPGTGNVNDHAGGIFVRTVEQMPLDDRVLLQSVAHVILTDQHGSLADQLNRRPVKRLVVPRLKPDLLLLSAGVNLQRPNLALTRSLRFFNGLGGFSPNGDEYVIIQSEGKVTPAPWVNVLANPDFGSVISESGQAYTWAENAHEFRLTPWENDPVQDSAGETFYLRDEETGLFWSPTALPHRGLGEYITRHGFGYSVFEHIEEGIHSELWVYVALDAPVKFSVLKVRNDSSRRRKLSATGYVEWVLGESRTRTAMHVMTEIASGGALLAHNYYNTEFGERTAFFDVATSRLASTTRTVTGDRHEFLGRNGSRRQPAALHRIRLSGRVGAGLDPCGAIHLAFDLDEGQTREFVFTLGAGQDGKHAETLAQHFHGTIAAQEALSGIRQYWRHTLSTIKVTTPDPALDLLANGWLMYQIISSRLWGRSGYYQSGGAFGFRDQLQDVMALVHAEPQRLRAHLLLCAAHQFVEGDVQHWWHPPQNRGVRTRCSDDYLWLPYVICHYIEATGDIAILDEKIAFLQGRLLNADEESYYDLPTISNEQASLYQHGVRAILHGLKFGEHGLPLMGSGDWNDGMDRVGLHGKGESVWLGFFLYAVLRRFSMMARHYGDIVFADKCESESVQLQKNLEDHGWDGEWYRRAYFDDGALLGSAKNTECRIDSIAQSWSVLSGAGEADHAKQAMASLYNYLVKSNHDSASLVLLLEPPFDGSSLNPGYIKGYVPGVRENGGQYTHAAIWAAMAFARLGENQLAWSLFNIINPIHHGSTRSEIAIYKIEPYVIAADVYSVSPHTGRGGWSWYTGSAGWMYRFISESLLGLKLIDKKLYLTPCMQAGWDSFQIDYRYGKTIYHIIISRVSDDKANDKAKITLDDIELDENIVPLVDDGKPHQVRLLV